MFGGTVPTVSDSGISFPIEVGVKFRPDTPGQITALRFYKSRANTGTHVAHLWDSAGTLLASATFTNETPSGWQQVPLPAPVPVTANTLYVASYHTDAGHVAGDTWFSTHPGYFFDITGVDATPLHMVSGAGPDAPNGVFAVGASAFPTRASQDVNWGVDVVFAPYGPRPSGQARPRLSILATVRKLSDTLGGQSRRVAVTAAMDGTPDLAPQIHRQRLVVEGTCAEPITAAQIVEYLTRLSDVCGMTALMEPVTHRSDAYGWAGWIHWDTSGAHFYAWEVPVLFFSVDVYACKPFDATATATFTRDFFGAAEIVARAF